MTAQAAVPVRRSEAERFRSAIVRRIGLQFEDARLPFLHDVLQRRLARHSCSGASYLWTIENRPPSAELAALAGELTVGETYFFRHRDQFDALAEIALPERMRARKASRALRLLSAGCASGEEPYSLAIVVKETVTDPSWNVTIRAVDLNPAALRKAALARYSPWALREAPGEIRRKWFSPERRELQLAERLRAAVDFGAGNLADAADALWELGAYDVIFCRNVLMYFSPEQMRAAVSRMTAALAPGGYLFLGHAESLRGVSDEFHLCHSHGAFYYRRKDRIAAPAVEPAGELKAAALPPALAAGLPAIALDAAWIETIRKASEHVAALTAATGADMPVDRTRPAAWRLSAVFDLLRGERFGEALDELCRAPAAAEADADVLLVKAVLLAQGDQIAAAEDTCRRLLLIDEFSAGAHYMLAMCRERAGDCERAMEHDRLAAHLDPAFAMPRLHCGLLARRAGDRETARREFAQALLLIEREDVARLLLFGGGFTRDALIALCRSAIAECGGRS